MKPTQYYIGLMSGTSMDGVDAVLIRMCGSEWHAADAHTFNPYPTALKQQLINLQTTGHNELHRSRLLAQQLSRLYAQTIHHLLHQTRLPASAITAIGCHGQTIRHAPEQSYSIQLADWALLAEDTGITTIGDFRSNDLAAGGQGAPLVPAFHQALFAAAGQTRVLLNIGGIANISILKPPQAAYGFDTGPGNMLIDAWMQHRFSQAYDTDGLIAARGRVLPTLLKQLTTHPYFQAPPPKSTGRELFSLHYLLPLLNHKQTAEDILRTLTAFSAATIAQAIQQYAPDADAIYLCGGGIHNRTLYTDLQGLLPHATLHSTADLNLNPQWVEAAAFGWLAACRVHHLPSSLPSVTGARGSRILGCVYLP